MGTIGVMAFIFFLVSSHLRQPPFTVTWKNERLSVIAEKASLSDILQEVDRQTGLKSSYPESLQKEISIRFYDLPLNEGVHRLLASMQGSKLKKFTAGKASSISSAPTSAQKEDRSPMAGNSKNRIKVQSGFLEDAALNAPDTDTRLASIQKLIKKDEKPDKAVLYAATRDSDPSIRQLAYHQLYRQDKDQAIDILFQDSASTDNDIRTVAIESSAQLLGAEATEILRNATEDQDSSIRQMAFQKLAQIKGNHGLEVIRESLSHADPEIRIMAIEAMASKGEEFANEAALSALEDNNELVRGKAEGLLEELDASRH